MTKKIIKIKAIIKRLPYLRSGGNVTWMAWMMASVFLWAIPVNLWAQPNEFTVHGKVIEAATGQPLAGVVVELHETHQIALTGDNGYFKLEEVRRGTYHLHATLLGYHPWQQTLTLQPNTDTFLLPLERTAIELHMVEVEEDLLRSGIKERPLSITVVDAQQMAGTYADNLATTLQQLPGISAINTGTGIGKPVIRGLSFNRVMVNQNGIKQEGQQWGADHGLEIDQYGIDKIEVIKGPASLLYGSDAMAGVINIHRKDVPDHKGWQGQLTTFYRSVNQLRGASLATGYASDRFFVHGRYTHQDFSDYRVPANTFIYNTYELPIENQLLKNTAGRERNGQLSVGTYGGWGKMVLHLSNFNQKAGLFAGAIGIPRAYRLTSDSNRADIDIPYQYTNHFAAALNGKWLLNKSWIHLDAGYQYNLRQEWSYPHIHGVGPAPVNNKALELILHTYTGNLRYFYQPNPRLKLVTGWNGQLQDNAIGGFEFLVPAYRSYQSGLFVFTEWKSTPKLTWSGGLRYDLGYYDLAGYRQSLYDSDTNIIAYRERSAPLQKFFHNISGSVGLAFQAREHWTLKANLGKSFRMPNGAELGMNGVHHGTFRHEMGDTSLQAERGYQFDIEAQLERSDILIDASAYFNYFDDYIFLRPTGSFSLLPDAGQIYRYTQADAIHTGWELRIDWHPIAPLHLEVIHAYVFNQNLTTGLPLPFTPPLNVRPGVSWEKQIPYRIWHHWKVSLQYDYYAAQQRTDRNEPATPAYGLLNISFSTRLGTKKHPVSLHFSVRNVMDTYYLNHLSRYRILNIPEPGRNFVITLRYSPHGFGGKK